MKINKSSFRYAPFYIDKRKRLYRDKNISRYYFLLVGKSIVSFRKPNKSATVK